MLAALAAVVVLAAVGASGAGGSASRAAGGPGNSRSGTPSQQSRKAQAAFSLPTTTLVGGPAPVIYLPPISFDNTQAAITTHLGPPVVTPATVACQDGQVIATLGGGGPYGHGPVTGQSIVDLTSDSPCYVSGSPLLQFSDKSDSPVQTTTVDGGYTGTAQVVTQVTLSPSAPASFLLQYPQVPNVGCPMETSLSIQLPTVSSPTTVNLRGVGLMVCGSVNVTPVIQGDSYARYI